MDHGCHIRIKRIHQLLRPLNNCNIHAKLSQIFCQFQTNKATTCQYSRFWMVLIYIFLYTKSVFYCTKCKKFINTNSRKSRLCWLCTWREDKFIVIFFKYFTILQIFH